MAEVLNTKKIIAMLESQSTDLDDLMNFMALVTDDGMRFKAPVKVEDLVNIKPDKIGNYNSNRSPYILPAKLPVDQTEYS